MIEILDTTLRDGVQGENINFSLDDKRAIIDLLDDLGFTFIEVGTPFGNPKDKQLLVDEEIKTNTSNIVAFGSTKHKSSLTDEDSALKVLAMSKCKYVSLVGKSSITHIEKVLGVTPQDNLKMIYDSVRYLSDKDKEVFFDAEHFFDGYKENRDYALDTLRTAKNAGATRLILCDTNGGSTENEIFDITRDVVKTFKKSIIGIHCHNDSGLAVANTMSAIEAGAQHIQGTFLGFGERCGNTNLSTIIPNLQLKKNVKIISAESLQKFTITARKIAEIANVALPKNIPYVGKSAFSHKGGMHGDGVMKYPPAFEHIEPELIGNSRRFLLSDVAGRAIFIKKAEEVLPDTTLSQDQCALLLDKLKMMEMQGYQFEGADASFFVFVRKALNKMPTFFSNATYSVQTGSPENGKNFAKANVSIKVNDNVLTSESSGNGPVDAIDTALRDVLSKSFMEISKVTLTDYKVRVINSEEATRASVRVLITSTNGKERWTTVGVSTDVIDASWKALLDSVEYFLSIEEKH